MGGANIFSIGRSGLNAAKKSLQTTSHNIANANTEGYSRQRVTQKTNTPVGEGSHVYGTGTNINEVKRIHDTLVESKLRNSMTDKNFHEERTYQLSRIEEVFNEVNSDGLNKILNRFFNSFRELSNQPENETVRAIVRDNAKIVVNDFNRVSKSLTTAKAAIDKKIDASILNINSLTKTVAKLNKEIVRLEVAGGETGDLRDQRDEAVRNISEYFQVHTYEDEHGQFVVNARGAGSLVAGGVNNEVKVGYVIPESSGNTEEGQAEIYFQGKPGHPISNSLRSGKLGGAIKTRNHEIVELKKELDQLAYGLSQSTNAIHRRGYVRKNIPVDQNGNALDDGSLGKITGINFFKDIGKNRGSEYIDLSDDVKKDLKNITTALTPNAPGDNRISIAISKLQHEKILDEGTTTFEEGYLKSVGKIGLRTAKAKIDLEQSSGILAQAKSIKERLSGVSIDEETANMVKFQHAYDASAKVIKTADEMFDAVMGMMR